MKFTSTFSKLAFVAAGLMLFASCSKNEDTTPNNIMEYRKETSGAQVMEMTSIGTDMVLEDRVNGVDYIIANNVEVNANLTIKPGVTLMFKNGAGLQVNSSGSLTAIGASGNVVLFTSESGKRSAWNGIAVLSNSAKNILSYCKIEHGGAAGKYGMGDVVVGGDGKAAQVEITNCEITASGTDGIVLAEGSRLNGFSGNKIHTNTGFPVSMHITDAGLINDLNTYVNNGKEFIKVEGNGLQVITKAITLKKLKESFLITGSIVAGNNFNVAAGSRIYMDNNAEIIIDGVAGSGSFSAVGSANSPISIAAIYNGTGIWNNIRFRSSDSNNNRIEYCTISGGGATGSSLAEGMISVVNDQNGSSNIIIRHSTIINSAALGIYIESANSAYNSDIISGNTFSNNVKGNVHFE